MRRANVALFNLLIDPTALTAPTTKGTALYSVVLVAQ